MKFYEKYNLRCIFSSQADPCRNGVDDVGKAQAKVSLHADISSLAASSSMD